MSEQKVRHLCAAESAISLHFNNLFFCVATHSLQQQNFIRFGGKVTKKMKKLFYSWLTWICGILFNGNEETVARAFSKVNRKREQERARWFEWKCGNEERRQRGRKSWRENLSQDNFNPMQMYANRFSSFIAVDDCLYVCVCVPHTLLPNY